MFSNSSSSKQRQTNGAHQDASNAIPTIVAQDMRIEGDLQSSGDLQVDGTISGNVSSFVILIGETGHVSGDITADRVCVRGRVDGAIRGREVTLKGGATVMGDITHESLEVARGAIFEGMVKTPGAAARAGQKPVQVLADNIAKLPAAAGGQR